MPHNVYFELGFLKIKPKDGTPKSLITEEFSFTITNENILRYACDIVGPVDIMPTKKKYMWSVKKPKFFESDRFFIEAMYGGDFDILVYRLIHEQDMTKEKYADIRDIKGVDYSGVDSTGQPEVVVEGLSKYSGDNTIYYIGGWFIEHVMNLHHCSIDSAEVGNFDGTKPVSENIQGIAQFFTFSQNVAGYYKKTVRGGDEL